MRSSRSALLRSCLSLQLYARDLAVTDGVVNGPGNNGSHGVVRVRDDTVLLQHVSQCLNGPMLGGSDGAELSWSRQDCDVAMVVLDDDSAFARMVNYRRFLKATVLSVGIPRQTVDAYRWRP